MYFCGKSHVALMCFGLPIQKEGAGFLEQRCEANDVAETTTIEPALANCTSGYVFLKTAR